MPNKSKIIVTNRKSMIKKYTPVGWETILDKLNKLIAFDLTRCIDTQVLYVDDYADFSDFNISISQNEQKHKKALDSIYNNYKPHYLVILGSQDIVPFQSLMNPTCKDKNIDKYIPSDLPYACDHNYSNCIEDFLNPTRIISRIPDVYDNPQKGLEVLIRTIYNIINMPRNPIESYTHPWSVCTKKRIPPMEKTLEMMKIVPVAYQTSPPSGPRWSTHNYGLHVHYHILHGEENTNILYGEAGTSDIGEMYPISIRGDYVDENINIGTVVLELACYGAQLYNPNKDERLPLANMYLRSGAVAMIGSCIPTFSNPKGVLLGDYMISSFYNNLNNHSIGEAFLLARRWLLKNNILRYLADKNMFGAFVLYGDASIVPIADKLFDEKNYNTISSERDINIPSEEPISICYPGPLLPEIIPDEIFEPMSEYLQSEFGVDHILDVLSYHLYEQGIENQTILMCVIHTTVNKEDVWYEFKYDAITKEVSFVCEYSH